MTRKRNWLTLESHCTILRYANVYNVTHNSVNSLGNKREGEIEFVSSGAETVSRVGCKVARVSRIRRGIIRSWDFVSRSRDKKVKSSRSPRRFGSKCAPRPCELRHFRIGLFSNILTCTFSPLFLTFAISSRFGDTTDFTFSTVHTTECNHPLPSSRLKTELYIYRNRVIYLCICIEYILNRYTSESTIKHSCSNDWYLEKKLFRTSDLLARSNIRFVQRYVTVINDRSYSLNAKLIWMLNLARENKSVCRNINITI